jgi:type IV pilus assembly protein PilC
MSYPIVVMVVASVVISLLLVKVVPQFESMFSGMGASLPAPTLIVLALSKFLQAYIVFIMMGIAAIILAIQKFYTTESGKRTIDKILLALPVFGDLLKKVAVARFCRTLGTMISSGVPILEALAIRLSS